MISSESCFVFVLFSDSIVLLFPSISPNASAAIAPLASTNGLSTNAYSAITTAIVTTCALLRFLNLNNVNIHATPIIPPTTSASENDDIISLNICVPDISPESIMFIIVIAPTMQSTSLMADSSISVLPCFLFNGNMLTSGITTALDIPPTIIPNNNANCMFSPNRIMDSMLVIITVNTNDIMVSSDASFTELKRVLKSIAIAPWNNKYTNVNVANRLAPPPKLSGCIISK